MANQLSRWIKKKLLGTNNNLITLNDPYMIIKELLKNTEISSILDAGASNGRISQRLLKIFPKANIYAFEPNPLYRQTLETFAQEDSRFHPQYLALSGYEGSAELFITESPGNTSLFSPGDRLKEIDPDGSTIKQKQDVDIVTIDQWAKRNNNVTIQLMKFDIQGAELQALQGAIKVLQKSTYTVYTEVVFNSLYTGGALFSEIDLFFRKQGFILYDLYKPKYNQNDQIMWANALYVDPGKLRS